MAETATAVDLNSKRSATRNKLVLSGRVESVRKVDDYYSHQVMLPADDEFSAPQTVELRASRKVFEKGEDFSVPVSLRGYRRSFKYTDRETGEQKQGEEYRAYLLFLGD